MILTSKQLKNFWDKVEKTDTCWNWKAYTSFGYGKVSINRNTYLAHKVSVFLDKRIQSLYKKEKGAAGSIVMHTCDNCRCVNPSHLVVSTQKENMRDALTKGRKWNGETAGENNPKAKLTVSIVKFIRRHPEKRKELAQKLKVNKSTIYDILNGRTWKGI